MNKISRLYSRFSDRLISEFTVPFILVLPVLVWIVFDREVWRGDPVGYALHAMSLYNKFLTDFNDWIRFCFSGYKAPLIFWVGQIFIGIGNCLGSIDLALLFIPWVSSYITLVLLFRSFVLLFNSKLIAACGCFCVAGSPLFVGISTGFWIEPMQIAIIAWFVYALVNARYLNFYNALAQFIIAGSIALLIKVSSPVYLVGPAIAYWIIVLRSKHKVADEGKNIFLLAVAFLFLLVTAVFYIHNLPDLYGFAHYAATSPLFGSESPRFDLWIENISDGTFRPITFFLIILLMVVGIAMTLYRRAYSNFGVVFPVAIFQIVIFFIAWMNSSNIDTRYFLPTLPYFAIILCWGLDAVKNKLFTGIAALILIAQFVSVHAFALGWLNLSPNNVQIRPVAYEDDRDRLIIQEIIPLATGDSAIVFDLNPELGQAEFQYELAKKNIRGNYVSASTDINAFFNFWRQEIDTAQINVDAAWNRVLIYNPAYYITWKSRLFPHLAEKEIREIDKYNATTIHARWTIAAKIKDCGRYRVVPFPSYPELLVYKRRDIP